MKRHIKQKPSLDDSSDLDDGAPMNEMNTEDLFVPPSSVIKSRSLESLKDALKDQEYNEEVCEISIICL